MSRLSYFIADFKYWLIFLGVSFVLGVVVLLFKRNRFILLLLAIGYTLLAILAVGEIYYRYIFDATDNVYHLKTTQRWFARHVQWNGNGYRDDHFWQSKDPAETRIIFLGDSYTFGYGIKNVKDRYSEILGAKLADACAPGKTLKTYNLGLPGNQSQTYLKLLTTEVFRFQPDAIVMQYYLDDIAADALPGQVPDFAQTIYGYKNLPLIGWLLQQSFALEYWYVRLAALFSSQRNWGEFINFNETLYRNEAVWNLHLSTLQHIIAATRGAVKVPLVIFIIPLSHRLGPNYPLTDIHQKLVQFFTGQQVPVIDLLPVLNQYRPNQIMVSRSDYHLNELGHELIAKELYNLLANNEPFNLFCR